MRLFRLDALGDPLTIPRAGPDNSLQTCLAFSPDGRTLIIGEILGRLHLWNIADRRFGRVVRPHTRRVNAIVFSPDGRLLATGGGDRKVRLIDARTYTPLATFSHQAPVRSLAFAPDGRTLASGSASGTVRLWNIATGQELAVLATLPESIEALEFTPAGDLLLAATNNEEGPSLWAWFAREPPRWLPASEQPP